MMPSGKTDIATGGLLAATSLWAWAEAHWATGEINMALSTAGLIMALLLGLVRLAIALRRLVWPSRYDRPGE